MNGLTSEQMIEWLTKRIVGRKIVSIEYWKHGDNPPIDIVLDDGNRISISNGGILSVRKIGGKVKVN